MNDNIRCWFFNSYEESISRLFSFPYLLPLHFNPQSQPPKYHWLDFRFDFHPTTHQNYPSMNHPNEGLKIIY